MRRESEKAGEEEGVKLHVEVPISGGIVGTWYSSPRSDATESVKRAGGAVDTEMGGIGKS